MVTLRSGFRACCTYSRGAVAQRLRASPFGRCTRSPRTSAPAPRQSSSAAGLSAKRTPVSSSTVSAFASISASPSSSRIS